MDAIHRSEEICLTQLFLQSENAYLCVAELGKLGIVQFRDMNPEVSMFQRKYAKEIRRCDEMERKLRYLEREIKKGSIPMPDTGENPEVPQPREMLDLEAIFEKLENELRGINQNEETLKNNFAELTELKHALSTIQMLFKDVSLSFVIYVYTFVFKDEDKPIVQKGVNSLDANVPMQLLLCTQSFNLLLVSFNVNVYRLLNGILWRACRGNIFLRHSEITETLIDAYTGDTVNKVVFIVFFQGEQLKSRIEKICEGFKATLYACPDTPQERREMSTDVMTRIEDLKTVLGQTQDHWHRVLVSAAESVRKWKEDVCKIKAIYHTLNLFNVDKTKKYIIAECWCPVADLEQVRLALDRGSEDSGSTVPSILNQIEASETPPTFHRTNKFTRGFQDIVDAYGIASYREINPAPYTIITFPFLFALMFGDVGHGIIMFVAALFLILKEKKLEAAKIRDEIFQTFFGGRYVILLMGLFSMYTGLIYNDFFGRSFKIFDSSFSDSYEIDGLQRMIQENPEHTVMLSLANHSPGGTYPFGVDPIWSLAEMNKLNFLNSMKMKNSIIIGVAQMTFGIVLSYYNYRHFNSRLDILYTFIPRLLFLSIFVYLCFEIIIKWIFFSALPGRIFGYEYPGEHCAPSLLIGLINMCMFKGREYGFIVDNVKGGAVSPTCHLNYWYPGQKYVETGLLFVALLSVPVMLFAKPFSLWMANRKKLNQKAMQSNYSQPINEDNESIRTVVEEEKPATGGHGSNQPFDLMDTLTYSSIHTIEFVLGCISHTASYLRLWALSLAHAQLSEVLWTMVFRNALVTDGYFGAIATYIVFAVFAMLTFSILVLMEGLSAFLHALRLHWVEFNSKFYEGDGYAFAPFSFKRILEDTRAEEEGPL
ncbi:V-type proton ATPase subunit a [Aphelenchoides bicaudatus]|nr:V-type proton ATPase subunit a [Aphelenchoides bicaudatus]